MEYCHCFCIYVHPEQPGICTDEDIVLVEMQPNEYARVVPMCGPCRTARPNGVR